MANPWEMDWSQGGNAAPAPMPMRQPTVPEMVVAPQVDPYKAEDQSIQRENARRSELEWNATHNPDGTPKPNAATGAAAGTDGERNNRSFYGRALRALETYDSIGLGPRSHVGQGIADNVWGGEGFLKMLPDSIGDSTDRMRAEQAKRDFAQLILRSDSGANAPEPEVLRLISTYFPQPGETDPEVIANYTAARVEALRGLREKAGRLAGDLPEYTGPRANAPQDPATAETKGEGWTPAKSLALYGQEYYDAEGNPLGPDGGMAYNKAGEELGLVGSITDESAPTPAEAEAARRDETFGKVGAIDLAGHGMTLGTYDEQAGIGKAIAGALTGDFDITGNYQVGRDAERIRIDQARDRLGWGGTAMEVMGGGALGKVGGGLNQLMQAGRNVAARGAPVTRGALQSQMARSAGREGATVGALGGFGYGEGLEGSATNALLGAATGGVLGFGGQRIGNALANRAPAPVAGGQVQRAADDLQIPVIPAVTGGTTARRLTGGARQGFISDRPISRAVDAMEAGGEAARNRTASQAGRVLDSEDAGNVVRQAANVYSKRTSQIGGNLYDRADRMAGGTTLPLPRAVAKADEWLGELGQSVDGAEGSLYKSVKSLRDKMAAGEFTVKGIRQTRTELREQLQERGLRGSATDKVFGEILEEATEDLFEGLSSVGKDNAAGALRTANAFWKKRVETIDEVLEPVLGKNAPRSGEQIVTAIESLMKPKTGNAARLRQLVDSMPREEARSVAATIISRMGQPTAGAAEKGSAFSFNTFLTNWNNMSPRARAAMFPSETRTALDKLATVSQGVKQAGAAANTSNTAGALGVQALISTPLLWLGDPLTIVAATGGQWAVGRLLASPRIARWIASTPKNPQARQAHIAKLGGIARAEPALANEIGLLQRAANDNIGDASRLAAEEQPREEQRR